MQPNFSLGNISSFAQSHFTDLTPFSGSFWRLNWKISFISNFAQRYGWLVTWPYFFHWAFIRQLLKNSRYKIKVLTYNITRLFIAWLLLTLLVQKSFWNTFNPWAYLEWIYFDVLGSKYLILKCQELVDPSTYLLYRISTHSG